MNEETTRMLITAVILGGAGCPESPSEQVKAVARAVAITGQLLKALGAADPSQSAAALEDERRAHFATKGLLASAVAEKETLEAELEAIRADLDKATRPAASKGAR